MKILLHKNFKKGYTKLRPGEKEKFKERRNLFFDDRFNPLLNNHALQGKYKGHRSISITGNIRVIYKTIDASSVLFLEIGTHTNLYS